MSGTDLLSPLARQLLADSSEAYSTLVPRGSAGEEVRRLLEGAAPPDLLSAPVVDVAAGYAVLAGIWLWHDGLCQCHEIVQKSPDDLRRVALNMHRKGWKVSQEVGSVQSMENNKSFIQKNLADMAPTLSFWHAIMHRREGDFSNAKYWYARCCNHPALERAGVLALEAESTPGDVEPLRRITRDGWDPDAFVDVVEAVHREPGDPLYAAAVRLQQLEWRSLFDHCARRAAGME